jgi:hypothetical protein
MPHMLPEPNFPVNPGEFIGRKEHLDSFAEALQHSTLTGRMASFAILGDWGIGKSSLLLKFAATCSDSALQMLPVTLSVSKDISDYMRFAERLCDRLAHALLTSDSLATRVRAEIENWKLTRVSVGALTVDRQSRRYFLSSGSALLQHALLEVWTHFIRPAYAGAIFFLDDLQNLATPTVQDTALIVRDQFQSFGIEGVNFSVCFTAKPDYFSGIRSFAEPAVRFYNKCALQPFSLKETAEYVRSVFETASIDVQRLAEWLHGKTLGHPYFLAFISRELWKLHADLAQLSEKEVALLRALALVNQSEFSPAPFAQQYPHQYFKRLVQAGLLIRTRASPLQTLPPVIPRVPAPNTMKQSNRNSEDVRAGTRRQACRRVPAAPFPLHCHKAESIPLPLPPLTHFPLAIRAFPLQSLVPWSSGNVQRV